MGKVKPDSIDTGTYHSDDVLDLSGFSHFQISSTYFTENHNHINRTEYFGNQAKCHLRKFDGISKEQAVFKGMRMVFYKISNFYSKTIS